MAKARETAYATKEQELLARERALLARESHQSTLLSQKDGEIAALRSKLSDMTSQVDLRVQEAIMKREEELRVLVMRREEEVAQAMRRREEEIMEAVKRREEEVEEAWKVREARVREEMAEEVEKEVGDRWREEWERLEEVREEVEKMRDAVEDRIRKSEEASASGRKGKKDKTPLEEVKNILAPLALLTKDVSRPRSQAPTDVTPRAGPTTATSTTTIAAVGRRPYETPVNRGVGPSRLAAKLVQAQHQSNNNIAGAVPASAMKGVILTATGETLATPTPSDLAKFFVDSPVIGQAGAGLGFSKIFESDLQKRFAEAKEESDSADDDQAGEEDESDEDGVGDDLTEGKTVTVTIGSSSGKKLGSKSSSIRTSSSSGSTKVDGKPPTSPGKTKERERQRERERETGTTREKTRATSVSASSSATTSSRVKTRSQSQNQASAAQREREREVHEKEREKDKTETISRPIAGSRLRRPSIRLSSGRTSLPSGSSTENLGLATANNASAGSSTGSSSSGSATATQTQPISVHANGRPQSTRSASTPASPPKYDFNDEENLPSPFLKKIEREKFAPTSTSSTSSSASSAISSSTASSATSASSTTSTASGSVAPATAARKRPSAGNMLRAVAAANSVKSSSSSASASGIVKSTGAGAVSSGGSSSSRITARSATGAETRLSRARAQAAGVMGS